MNKQWPLQMDNQTSLSAETRTQAQKLMKMLISEPQATPAWKSLMTLLTDFLTQDIEPSPITNTIPHALQLEIPNENKNTTSPLIPSQDLTLQVFKSDINGIKDLKPTSSLPILSRLNEDPCNFLHRDVLVQAVNDVIPDMTLMGAQKMIRTLLAEFCIETKMDDFFRITSAGMERLRKEKAIWNCKHGRWTASLAKAKQGGVRD